MYFRKSKKSFKVNFQVYSLNSMQMEFVRSHWEARPLEVQYNSDVVKSVMIYMQKYENFTFIYIKSR